jgi:hypothetical protein
MLSHSRGRSLCAAGCNARHRYTGFRATAGYAIQHDSRHRRQSAYPGDDRDLSRRDQSDLDGTFTLPDVVPGSYTLLAIDNGWDLNWSEPDVIATYVKHGRRIEVSGQGSQPVNVADIQVQPK